MALACLVCRTIDCCSSSENESHCVAIVNCLARKVNALANDAVSSKVAPLPLISSACGPAAGNPRLVRSLALTREHVRDWRFEETAMDG